MLILIINISACAQRDKKETASFTVQSTESTVNQNKIRRRPAPDKESPNWWYQQGAGKVYQLAKENPFPKKAKNVILIVGDGMNMSTVTAARILAGQKQGQLGEEFELEFEKFPQTALSKTYSLDFQVSSSAATMSAMMTGVKTNKSHISVNGNGVTNECDTVFGNEVVTLLELAEQSSMSTGVVTTARLTHATPAATYAHTVTRYWEADEDIPVSQRNKGCKDIARQLIEFPYGDGLEVAMGGGRRNFLPNSTTDPEYPNKKGERLDGRDLTKEWTEKYENAASVWNLDQFNDINVKTTKHLLGLFEPKHMKYAHDKLQGNSDEPSISEMTKKALGILNHQNKPFFLMIESGRIDHAHHDGNAFRALHETIELNNAVKTVMENVDLNETLIIVTADHAHTFNMGGYPQRGNPILGLVKGPKWKKPSIIEYAKDDNGNPYTTLAYTNGPGHVKTEDQKKLTHEQVTSPDYLQAAAVPRFEETHGGEDVAIYATGAGSYTVKGVLEQNVIFHIMKHALGL